MSDFPEVEALIAFAEYGSTNRAQQVELSTCFRVLMNALGLESWTYRRQVPDVVPAQAVYAVLKALGATLPAEAQPQQLLLALQAGPGASSGYGAEPVVLLDALLLFLCLCCAGSLSAKLHMAFWTLDREGRGGLGLDQVLRAVPLLTLVARVAVLVTGDVDDGGGGRRSPSPGPRLEALVAAAYRSLDPGGSNLLPEAKMQDLLFAVANQMSAAIVDGAQQQGSATPAASSDGSYSSQQQRAAAHKQQHGSSSPPSRLRNSAQQQQDSSAPKPSSTTSPTGSSGPLATVTALLPAVPPSRQQSQQPPQPAQPQDSSYPEQQQGSHKASRSHSWGLLSKAFVSSRRTTTDSTPSQPPQAPQAPPRALQLSTEPSFKRHLTREDSGDGYSRRSTGGPPVSEPLQAQLQRAEQAERAEVDPERRLSKNSRQLQPPRAAAAAGGLSSTIQGQIQDVGLKLFLHCGLCCLLLLALIMADAAFVAFVFISLQLRLEIALAVAVGFNVALAVLIALGLLLRSYYANRAAAAAAQRASGECEGEQGGAPPVIDGPLGQVLQPVARIVHAIKRELRGPSRSGSPEGVAPTGSSMLVGRLRSLWATIGRVAGFDQYPAAAAVSEPAARFRTPPPSGRWSSAWFRSRAPPAATPAMRGTSGCAVAAAPVMCTA